MLDGQGESAGVKGEAEVGMEGSITRLGRGLHQDCEGSLQRACEGTARKAQEAEETQKAHLADGTERGQTGSPGLNQDHQTLPHLPVLPSLSHLLPPGVNMPFP